MDKQSLLREELWVWLSYELEVVFVFFLITFFFSFFNLLVVVKKEVAETMSSDRNRIEWQERIHVAGSETNLLRIHSRAPKRWD